MSVYLNMRATGCIGIFFSIEVLVAWSIYRDQLRVEALEITFISSLRTDLFLIAMITAQKERKDWRI